MFELPRIRSKQPDRPKLADIMGPGLITGASDDDPSGIATYSQAGAQFGYSLGWTLLLTYPLMCAIQMISAQVGRVTGRGLAGNMRRHYPAPVVYILIALLLFANVINIGADLGAMAAALRLLVDGPQLIFVAAFAVITVLLEVFMRYSRYASVLRWLTISLFAYVGTVFAVSVPWLTVAHNLVVPHDQVFGGLSRHRGCSLWHHHQPLSILLAGGRRSRRREGGSEGEAPDQGAAASRASVSAHPARHARWHGHLEHRRSIHHDNDRGDVERPWRHRHPDLFSGG